MMLYLPGARALSGFRRARLAASLAAVAPQVRGVDARYVHLADLERDLGDDEHAVLGRLLDYGAAAPAWPSPGELLVLPRFGTISPWSTKATDIARHCGLDAVRRLERGVAYRFDGSVDEAALASLAALVHDRMTEAVVRSADEARALFLAGESAPPSAIAVTRDGRAALVEANAALGLALSEPEIDHLYRHYAQAGRDPSDAELMMFAQANSEHCRHKIFNADWTIDGEAQAASLFAMIRNTHARSPAGVLSAYRDNAAVVEGTRATRLCVDAASGEYRAVREPVHLLMKVETHNHPTAISPFPGAATGSGGEIRDEAATGRGARPKAGLTGFSVSNLQLPGHRREWERDNGRPDRIATPLQIMLEGPIGAASFNNEFGRPALCGYFRTYEQRVGDGVRGYHKPIMLAGGMGNVRPVHVEKSDVPAGAVLIVLGGPAMQIGLGGGAASSMSSGQSDAELDFASVQRGNAEMQRRAQEVIEACAGLGEDNPVLVIHDVGAGGLSNAVPEVLDHSSRGGRIELRDIPVDEAGMSPMAIWCNESQERYVLAVAAGRAAEVAQVCRRERCPHAIIGEVTDERRLVVHDRDLGEDVVDIPMETLLGSLPRQHREVRRGPGAGGAFDRAAIDLADAVQRILRLPTVADKRFLITIGDRSVGGLCHRDQMVGPWQVPVSDVAVTCAGFDGYSGEAMAVGERTPAAVLDGPASGRLAVTEAVTNLLAAGIDSLTQVRLSANWMAAAGHGDDDAVLYDTVRAVGEELCPALGIAIPVGKDSLSMRTSWEEAPGGTRTVAAPVSLIVSAFAPVADVRATLTPQLRRDAGDTELLLIDLGGGRNRLGGSSLAQVYGAVGAEPADLDDPARLVALVAALRELRGDGLLLAYHDRSDGGLLVTACEMAFAGRCGVALELPAAGDPLASLFAEEPGVVVQIRSADTGRVYAVLERHGLASVAATVGRPTDGVVEVRHRGRTLYASDRPTLQALWSETSWQMQSLRDNPECAREEYEAVCRGDDPGLHARLGFDPAEDVAAPFVHAERPRVAILREQGVNGQLEMAAAFARAGFTAVDVHMSDLLAGSRTLAEFQGLAACGGFSYGDVLGGGEGWAKTILFNARLRDQFSAFFDRADTFTLGVCNGCQMLASLRSIIPGADGWPRFVQNRSEQFEARLSMVEVLDGPSPLLAGMGGSLAPIVVSHGEGRAEFEHEDGAQRAVDAGLVILRYVDNRGAPATRYPANPNGSPLAIAGLCSADGRVTITMPHPERVFRTVQMSWAPPQWGEDSPWMRLFRNARVWVGRRG